MSGLTIPTDDADDGRTIGSAQESDGSEALACRMRPCVGVSQLTFVHVEWMYILYINVV